MKRPKRHQKPFGVEIEAPMLVMGVVHKAQFGRRVHLIETANALLHPDNVTSPPREPGDYVGGKWQSYVS